MSRRGHWALQAAPFAVLAPMRGSAVVRYLSLHMPLGVVLILAACTLRGVPTAAPWDALPFAAAVVVTGAVSHRRAPRRG